MARIRARVVDRRKDTIEKATTELAQTEAAVVVEDLEVTKVMASSRGTVENPGEDVALKRALNRKIADAGWAMFVRRLGESLGPDRVTRINPAFAPT